MRILPYFVRKHLSLIQVYPSTELDQTIMKQIISLQDRISDYHHQTWKDRHHRRRVEGHRVDGGVSLAACPTTGSGWWWCWVAEGRVEMAWAVELVTEWDVYGCRFLEVVYMYIYIGFAHNPLFHLILVPSKKDHTGLSRPLNFWPWNLTNRPVGMWIPLQLFKAESHLDLELSLS
jgi:hypothetical protein